MSLIDGAEQGTLMANDYAAQFGGGCFSTVRIQQGQVVLLDTHLQHLQITCEKLQIPFHDWLTLSEEMQRLAWLHAQGVLKVISIRGIGGRGYSTAGRVSPTRILSVSPFPVHYARWREGDITLTQSPVPLGRNPRLTGLKHLNRLEQVLIRSHLEQTDADEALALDSDGRLTEYCAANSFQRQGRDVFTPWLDHAGVNGIMRQHCIAQLVPPAFRVVEVTARSEVLREADEVLICSALTPLVPVRRWEETVWPSCELYHFLAPLYELSGQYEENVTFYSTIGGGAGHRRGGRHAEGTPVGGQRAAD